MTKSSDTVTLYRPLGEKELALVKQSHFKQWPPRLPDQPIFYPVTNEAYAIEIAQKWNTKNGASGYVARFLVQKIFMNNYSIQIVGARHHSEWWIPAEDLEKLNNHIIGTIQIIHHFQS